jgi:hypothetical protein
LWRRGRIGSPPCNDLPTMTQYCPVPRTRFFQEVTHSSATLVEARLTVSSDRFMAIMALKRVVSRMMRIYI